MAAPNWLEACLVLNGRDHMSVTVRLERVIRRLGIEIVLFDESVADLARTACRRQGRKSHPVELNDGDCMAYVLAKRTGEPLLYEGSGFARTGFSSALA